MKAPDFCAETTFGTLQLSDFKDNWIVLFSHPGDFTPVCTTEFIAFAEQYPQFTQRNVQLIGLSIDSTPSHLAWVQSIYEISNINIPFPIIADRDGSIASLYGMIAPEVTTKETVRNVYIIDPEQIIRCILIYPLTTGRCIGEILRIIKALQTSDQCHVATPANWEPGDPVINPTPKTIQEVMKRVSNSERLGLDCKSWYLCFKENHPNRYGGR